MKLNSTFLFQSLPVQCGVRLSTAFAAGNSSTGNPAVRTSKATLPLVLVAGGKSGGHIFPALAVAEELRTRGWRVEMVGAEDSMEKRLAEKNGVPFHAVEARPLVGRGMIAKIKALMVLGRSAFQARRLLRRLRPDAVLGTGGFVSAPTVLGARLAGVPSLLIEPNAEVGVANRWLSLFATGAVTAWPETVERLHCITVATGIPVRTGFFAVPALEPKASREETRRVVVLGGSQGSRSLNLSVPLAFARLRAERGEDLPHIELLHQAGRERSEEASAAYREALGDGPAGGLELTVTPFLDDTVSAMASADLVLSRAGAITLAELQAAGRGALLVPLPIAGGHQEDNARAVASAGAAVVVLEESTSAEPEVRTELAGRIAAALARVLVDEPTALAEMGARARELAKPEACAEIASFLEGIAKSRPVAGEAA